MIPILPDSLRIVATENTVFRRRRSGLPLDEDLGEFSNAAQVVIGYFQSIQAADLERLYDPKISAEVIAAGRILDAASRELLAAASCSAESDDLQAAVATGLLAAIANAFYGNFPAAATIAKRFAGIERLLSPLQLCGLCCCAPELVGQFLPFVRANQQASSFLENLESFLRTGDEAREQATRAGLLRLRELLDKPFDHSVWLSCEVCFEQLVKLATAKTLKELLGASAAHYVDLLAKSGMKTLLPPQFLALNGNRIASNSSNAVICLPTSTGKTFLSELCIYSSVKRPGRLGIFVVPYVALGRQIADRIFHHLPRDWKVVRLFGGYKQPGSVESSNQKLFLVATPERLDGLLRYNPETLSRTDCVVFDEGHIIENGRRGARVEGLVARVLLAQKRLGHGRVVLVSAVIPNASVVANWIGANPSNVVNHSWTPNSRRIAVWRPEGNIIWYHSRDPVSPVGVAPDQQIASVHLPWPRAIVPTKWDFPESVYFEGANYENLVYLCSFMWNREREPVLCACATRETTRQTAALLAKRFEPVEPIPPGTQKAMDLISERYRHYTHLKNALSRAVAYHNASLPHDLRAAIEEAAMAKELRCVVSTTTLAEGVDLPFRVTVIADWLRHTGDNTQTPYSPLLVRNIAGRCGRVGYFTEGDIVIYDNPLGARKYKAPWLKNEWQRKVFFSIGDEGIHSALEQEFTDPSVKATLASQFLASIAENPEQQRVEQAFANALFVPEAVRDSSIRPFIDCITTEITSQEWHLAERNSPLRLTPLGVAVNQSGFSPSSCQRIVECLTEAPALADGVTIGDHLLTQLGDLPEQNDAKFTKLVERDKRIKVSAGGKKPRPPRIYLRLEYLPAILRDWLDGKQPVEIFASLPLVVNSDRQPAFSIWLQGTEEVTGWEAEFDKFCDFLRTTVFEFLPSLLRACSLLAPHSNWPSMSTDWQALAECFQRESTITSKEDTVG